MENDKRLEANEHRVIEIIGTLFYNPELEEMWLDVEFFRGPWLFSYETPTVRVKCRVVEYSPETR
jgi:hypothetical protein